MGETYYVGYEDSGPSGVCGQTVSCTASWRKLFVFTDYQKAKDFVSKVAERPLSFGRIRPHIVGFWMEVDGCKDVEKVN